MQRHTIRLQDKVAIVTGASAGIGGATARALAREGANVIITYHTNRDGAEKVAQDIRNVCGNTLILCVDISKQDDVQRMVQRTIDEFGQVDILVNNAAYLDFTKPFVETTLPEWKAEIDTSLIGTILCTSTVLPHMIKQKSGRIISVTSSSAKRATTRDIVIYATCKAAVAAFSKALARDLATTGLTINCVAAGPVKTEKLYKYFAAFPEKEKEYAALIPMQRLGEPEDIANMIVFLASDDAKFITGQNYSVGLYTITETDYSPAWITAITPNLGDPLQGKVTVVAGGQPADAEVTVTNTVQVGTIIIHKHDPDGNTINLAGFSVSVTPNPYTGTGTLIVHDNGPHGWDPVHQYDVFDPNDANHTFGTIELDDVPLSPPTYDIVEKTAPTGYMVSSDVLKATVTSPTVPAEVTSVDFPSTVPTLSQWVIIGMIGAFGILLVWTGKRRLARKNN